MGKCTYILAQPCGNSTGRPLEMPPHGLGVESEIRRAGHGVHWPAGKGQSRWQGKMGARPAVEQGMTRPSPSRTL